MRPLVLLSVAVLAVAGCSGVSVVNTNEPRPEPATSTTTAPPLPSTNPALLANAFDFVGQHGDQTAYYFTTPSGRWQCAIVPRSMAGCQSATGALSIAGAPDTVPDTSGTDTASDPTSGSVPNSKSGSVPNAIVIKPDGDVQFVALDQPGFTLVPGPATVLPFNRTLIVARFRCNVQEATGVSCLSEDSGKGFSFDSDGFTPRYTEVPVDAT